MIKFFYPIKIQPLIKHYIQLNFHHFIVLWQNRKNA